ncbi:hypothetical protein SMSKK35_3063 [Stenotrophomonas maltophilia SKK35]|nr:hypothetical protein SMSKK35_3063 [Stenotrophomonas maltophilia SKK35]
MVGRPCAGVKPGVRCVQRDADEWARSAHNLLIQQDDPYK